MKKQSNKKEDSDKKAIFYIQPDKPLVYNFFDITNLNQLFDKEPTSGRRKEAKKEEQSEEKIENIEMEKNKKDEEDTKNKKKVQENTEIFEGKLRDEAEGKQKKVNDSENSDIKTTEGKKGDKNLKIKFKKYCNAFNVSNNKLTTISGIYDVLMELLPELSFKSKLNKVELIQWIDISRNKLTEISSDIARLPFLKILYVHGNNIQQIENVTELRRCQSLTSLTLYGNPIDHIKGYRNFIIEMCPLLEKLDSAVISEKELDIIKFRGSRYGEKRAKDGHVIKFPKLPDEIIKTIQMAEQNAQEKKDES